MEKITNSGLVKHVEADFAERIGGGGHDFFGGSRWFVVEHDFAVWGGVRFAHFSLGILEVADANAVMVATAGHEGDLFFWRGGQGESFSEFAIETFGEATGALEMLELVFADRDIFRIVE